MKTKVPQDHGLYQSGQVLLKLGFLYGSQDSLAILAKSNLNLAEF